MGAWDDYRSCCRSAAARDREATFCPECGHPLFRCPAPGCASLLTPLGHCPSCIDLRLSIEKGAHLTARAGECLSLPFVLAGGPAAHPLAIKGVVRDGTNLQQAAVPVPWDQLEPGRARALAVEVGPFPQGGLYSVRLTIAAAAAPGDIEEVYAFSGEVAIDVEGSGPAPHVHLENAELGTGAGVYVVHNGAATGRRVQGEVIGTRTDIRLERAERFEMQQGHRGYDRLGARLPRNVPFAFTGFPEGDRPPDGPLVRRPVVRCGRNGRTFDAAQNPEPNDLCLRVYRAGSSELDREASVGISRRACDLLLANDRLYARAVGRQGLAVGGDRLAAGESRAVCHGDVLEVPAGRGRTVALGIAFKVSGGLVTQVRVEKAS